MNIKELLSLFNWWDGISREMLGVFSVFRFDLLFCSQGGLGRLWTRSQIHSLQLIKSLGVSIVSPSICHEVMGPDAMIFVF